MTSPHLYAAVVLYRFCCAESPACRYLIRHADPRIRLLIYDNSPFSEKNRSWCQEHPAVYLGGDGNRGLSVAYNACLEAVGASDGHILWLDEDSTPEETYTEQLLRLSLPALGVSLVRSADRLLSPTRSRGVRMIFFRDEKEALSYHGGNLTAINAGLCVSLSLYRSYRYDERIFLDGIDHQFLRDMKARGIRPVVLPVRIEQRFSGDETPPKEQALTRYKIFLRDYRRIERERPLRFLALVAKRALRLTLTYRTADFFRSLHEVWQAHE